MKYVLVSLIALFIFSFSAFSQDEGKIGVGASFGTNLVVSSSQSNPIIYNSMIYVPINMSGFRLEPFLMINTSSNKYQVEGQPNTYERSMTGITFGSGFFFLMRANKSVVPYLGLRVGYGTNSSKSKSQYSDSIEKN
ncbi:MAG: hypothetical protein M1419_02200 [Bacteroidetes bacterium]|nr:hypothetical protein [Bacteroidota bacterium]